MKVNKKEYIMPQMEVIKMGSNHLLAGSDENGSYGEYSDAPAMMDLSEEEIHTEYED